MQSYQLQLAALGKTSSWNGTSGAWPRFSQRLLYQLKQKVNIAMQTSPPHLTPRLTTLILALMFVADTALAAGDASSGPAPYATSLNVANGQTSATDVGNASGTTTINGGSVNISSSNTTLSGNATVNGTLTQTGSTNINTTGTAATTIGGSGNTSAVTINSGNNSVGVSNTGTSVTAGNGQTNTISGTTDINTTGTAATTMGSSGNTAAVSAYSGSNSMVVSNSNVTAIGAGSQFVLNNNGANFSNTSTGAPIQLHGVANGSSTYDAINYGQLKQVIAGVAGVAAMANIPHVDIGKTFSVGAGISSFMGANALAIGATFRLAPNAIVKASVAALNNYSSQTVYGLGAAISW
jgi:hypothetical protein